MGKSRIRGKIRSFTRQDNQIGATCSILLQLSHGDIEAAREIYCLHFIHNYAAMRLSHRELKVGDPYYNPNLALQSEDVSFAMPKSD